MKNNIRKISGENKILILFYIVVIISIISLFLGLKYQKMQPKQGLFENIHAEDVSKIDIYDIGNNYKYENIVETDQIAEVMDYLHNAKLRPTKEAELCGDADLSIKILCKDGKERGLYVIGRVATLYPHEEYPSRYESGAERGVISVCKKMKMGFQ